MKYSGRCHCGDVAFEVEGELTGAVECNCSICSRKGALLWFVDRNRFRLTTPEANVSTYVFGKEMIQHKFCARCGIHPFGEGARPDGAEVTAINLRCLEGVDIDGLDVQQFDGASL